MDFRRIKPTTFAILVVGVLALLVGTYTDNGGFQLAGGLFLLVAVIVGFNEANRRDGGR